MLRPDRMLSAWAFPEVIPLQPSPIRLSMINDMKRDCFMRPLFFTTVRATRQGRPLLSPATFYQYEDNGGKAEYGGSQDNSVMFLFSLRRSLCNGGNGILVGL